MAEDITLGQEHQLDEFLGNSDHDLFSDSIFATDGEDTSTILDAIMHADIPDEGEVELTTVSAEVDESATTSSIEEPVPESPTPLYDDSPTDEVQQASEELLMGADPIDLGVSDSDFSTNGTSDAVSHDVVDILAMIMSADDHAEDKVLDEVPFGSFFLDAKPSTASEIFDGNPFKDLDAPKTEKTIDDGNPFADMESPLLDVQDGNPFAAMSQSPFDAADQQESSDVFGWFGEDKIKAEKSNDAPFSHEAQMDFTNLDFPFDTPLQQGGDDVSLDDIRQLLD